jgi:hypothetical protein
VARTDEGENGLKRLDKLIKLAEKKGVKLLLTLANNWADYGGYVTYFVCIKPCQNLKSACSGWTYTPSTLVENTMMTYVSTFHVHGTRIFTQLDERSSTGSTKSKPLSRNTSTL